ncbi:SDR family oxidoreductase [Streptacidiphilus griseoplanus]|uniref:SDR family oxidoreductase n=1 Tax=Peterkaempfera griseoplana TaxID=66896 RepID=UPI0006E15823
MHRVEPHRAPARPWSSARATRHAAKRPSQISKPRAAGGASCGRTSHFLGQIPTERAGAEDDVAAFTAFLLSNESTFINGAALTVGGGFTAR